MITALSRLLRIPNLAMVFLTMYLMRWSIIRPILELTGYEPEMPEITFLFLVLSTVFITAAGNVINDYHDIHADRHNHPDKVVIDKKISRRQAIILHFVLNLIGISMGIFVSIWHRLYWLSPIFILVPVILWFYSTTYKHKVFIGNFLISLLTAMVPLLVLLFEYPLIRNANRDVLQQFPDIFNPVIYWIGLFSLFAFLTNLIREIIKDAEDVAGDREVGSKTIAVIYGVGSSKILALVLAVLSFVGLSIVFFIYLSTWMSLVYFGILLAVPFLLLIIQLPRALESKDFHRLSLLVKVIMLAGLLYAPLAYLVMKVVMN